MMSTKVVGLRVGGPRRTFRYCLECALEKFHAANAAQLELLANVRILGTVLTDQDDEELFGKICVKCKTPLADWCECRYCHALFWAGSESHGCDAMRTVEERMRRKYGNEWDGTLDWQVTSWHRSPIAN